MVLVIISAPILATSNFAKSDLEPSVTASRCPGNAGEPHNYQQKRLPEIQNAKPSKHQPPQAKKNYQHTTYSLHWSSFLGLPYRILIIYLVKPKKGTTMETIGRFGAVWGFGIQGLARIVLGWLLPPPCISLY